MSARPLYVGIDLGTTNSTAAAFDGERITVVRNAQGGVLTPSVVRVDARGRVSVGVKARRFLDADPENTRGEFKRLMGTTHVLEFRAAGVSRKPQELGAEVLRSLRKDAEHQFGVSPERAVVSVPALFELPQTTATSEAARLAGFEQVELIQEPVASAMAAGWSAEDQSGAWLVYDLGGGTFDASLLETREGLLRVVGHDGDNFLGGRDFDAKIVEWLIAEIERDGGVRIDRADPVHAAALRRLRVLAEEAKMELSREEQTSLVLPGLAVGDDSVDVDLVLDRADFEALVSPLVDRTIAVCRRLLAAHGLEPSSLGHVVLVGGPTVMPVLRQRVGDALGAPFSEALDPMTLVAQGAALFAGMAALDARPPAKSESKRAPNVWLQHPAMTADVTPYVVGKLFASGANVQAVRVRRDDGTWQSEAEVVDGEGTFSLMVRLEPRKKNAFTIEGLGKSGETVQLEPSSFAIVHGVTISEPPLSRSIGVALANDKVQVYVERGSPLPMRRTFTLKSVEPATVGVPGFALRIPIVQGEFAWAHLCRLVGTLEIPGERLRGPLPGGSAIEVTIELDRGGRLKASARVPSLDQVFDEVAQLVVPGLAPEQLQASIAQARERTMQLRASAFRDGAAKTLSSLADAEQTLHEAEQSAESARGGDADAAEQARRLLLDLVALLDEAEAGRAWPELEARARMRQGWALGWLGMHGTPAERAAADECGRAIDRALAARSAREVERQLSVLRRLGVAAYLREPDAWEWELEEAASQVSDAPDLPQAMRVVERGRAAARTGDRKGLESAVRQLWTLVPADREERRLSHGSGVH